VKKINKSIELYALIGATCRFTPSLIEMFYVKFDKFWFQIPSNLTYISDFEELDDKKSFSIFNKLKWRNLNDFDHTVFRYIDDKPLSSYKIFRISEKGEEKYFNAEKTTYDKIQSYIKDKGFNTHQLIRICQDCNIEDKTKEFRKIYDDALIEGQRTSKYKKPRIPEPIFDANQLEYVPTKRVKPTINTKYFLIGFYKDKVKNEWYEAGTTYEDFEKYWNNRDMVILAIKVNNYKIRDIIYKVKGNPYEKSNFKKVFKRTKMLWFYDGYNKPEIITNTMQMLSKRADELILEKQKNIRVAP
jgi:hypothetical protein